MGRKSPFPRYSLDEALLLARTIWERNAGNPIRRLTLFDILKRKPESRSSRDLVTASSNYGLTKGSYIAEVIELTERGRAIAERNALHEKLNAVLEIEVFRAFFENYQSGSIPSEMAALDFLTEQGITERSAPVCLEVILESGRQVALIQEISGAERIVSRDHALEKMRESFDAVPPPRPKARKEAVSRAVPVSAAKRFPSLNINLEIHLPAGAKPEVYEIIFKNIRDYLMGEE